MHVKRTADWGYAAGMRFPLPALDRDSLCIRSLCRRHFSSLCGPLIGIASASALLHSLLSPFSSLWEPLVCIASASALFLVALLLRLRALDLYSLCIRSLYCRPSPPLTHPLIKILSDRAVQSIVIRYGFIHLVSDVRLFGQARIQRSFRNCNFGENRFH